MRLVRERLLARLVQRQAISEELVRKLLPSRLTRGTYSATFPREALDCSGVGHVASPTSDTET